MLTANFSMVFGMFSFHTHTGSITIKKYSKPQTVTRSALLGSGWLNVALGSGPDSIYTRPKPSEMWNVQRQQETAVATQRQRTSAKVVGCCCNLWPLPATIVWKIWKIGACDSGSIKADYVYGMWPLLPLRPVSCAGETETRCQSTG